MNKIFHYLDKKTKFYTVIGALANGGLALAQPLVVSRALSLNQGELTYFKIVQFALFGFTVYFVLYSLMLFCNHTHNAVSYTHLDVYKRQMLGTFTMN